MRVEAWQARKISPERGRHDGLSQLSHVFGAGDVAKHRHKTPCAASRSGRDLDEQASPVSFFADGGEDSPALPSQVQRLTRPKPEEQPVMTTVY